MPRGATDLVVSNLFDWRCYKELTQAELARRAGVGEQTVVRAERGERIRALNVHKLARALGISMHQLLEERPE